MKSFILVLGIAISSILHSKANNLSDTTQLINAIQYFNAQTLNLCCSDSITIVNTIILVRNQFEEVINNYPNSYLKDDTQYFIGKIYQYGYTPQNQIIEWQKIIDLYPGQFFSTITTGSSWYSNYPNPGLSFVPSDAWAMQQVAGGLLTPVNYTLGFQMIDTIVAHFPDICQSAEALLMKGDYYNGLGQRYDAVEKYEEVLDLFPQCLATCGYAYDRIGAMMAAIGDWAVIDTFRQKLENEYCIDNHLAEGNFAILQNNRWNKPTPFVLSIYANASNAIDSMLVDSVITIYETMFPNVLSFNWVPEQGQGGNPYNGVDIEIEFWPYGFNYAQVGGFGFYPYREIYRSIIHVSNTPSFTSRLKTLIHEMGHSLGLGHSFNNEDIMFFSTSQVAEPMLSERDSVTLQMLYSPFIIDTIYNYENDTMYLYDGSKHFYVGTYNTSIFNKENCDTAKFIQLNILPGIQGEKIVCIGSDTLLTYSVSPFPGASNYIWSLPTGFVGSSLTNVITINITNQAMSGYMIVKAIVGSDTIKNKIFIQVGYKPQTPIISELNDSTLISSAAFGNQWYNHYGKISNAVDSFIFVNMSGEYFVQVDSNGCISDISESYIYIHQYNQYDPPCDTITWAGGFDFENWMDPQNWIGGIIPDSCTYVLVPIGSTVRIRDFSTAVAKKLLNMGYIYIQGWGKLHVMGPDSFGIKNVSSTFINNGTVVIENSFYGLVNQNSSFENQNKLNIFGIDSIGIFNNNLSTFSNVGTTLANILPNKAIVNSQSTIFNYGQLILKVKSGDIGMENDNGQVFSFPNSIIEIKDCSYIGFLNKNNSSFYNNGYLYFQQCTNSDFQNTSGSLLSINGIIDITK